MKSAFRSALLMTGVLGLFVVASSAQGAKPGAESGAQSYSLRGDWQQGRLIFGRTDPQAKVEFDGKSLLVSPHGDFVFGLDRDQATDVTLSVAIPGRAAVVKHYAVRPHQWDVQRIDGLPPTLVNPPPETEARIAHDQELIVAAHARDTERGDFLQHFAWPANGRVSGIFGSQRILNGTPKAPHYGVDVAVPIGTPVRAPAGGIVSLAEPDLYFTGGTLIIDHGHGVSSVLVHLSKLEVKVGDEVRQGEVVALSGMSGRATGPHLHWGVYWFGQHVDPQTLVPAMSAIKADAKQAKRPH